MKFYNGGVFHIFNQGNNRHEIFYSDDNYNYFIHKMRTYLDPFGDIISYCLMPNHFHVQLKVNQIEITKSDFKNHLVLHENQRRKEKYGDEALLIDVGQEVVQNDSLITLNQAIGIMQASYSRALNKRYGWSGSRFRKHCKAKDGWIIDKSSIYYNSEILTTSSYIPKCFNYIHENPVAAGLVDIAHTYPWSSAKDYFFNFDDSICNLELGRQLTLQSLREFQNAKNGVL